MRLRLLLPAVFCGAALAACADQSVTSPGRTASPAVIAAEARPVPFKLQCDMSNFQPGDTEDPADIRLTMEGTCLASHLGNSTVFIDQTDALVRMEPPMRFGQFSGIELITAANGDVLRIRHHGPTTINFATGAVTFGGEVVVDGGTGRFEHASGTGTFSGEASLFAGVGRFDMDAMIVYGGRAE